MLTIKLDQFNDTYHCGLLMLSEDQRHVRTAHGFMIFCSLGSLLEIRAHQNIMRMFHFVSSSHQPKRTIAAVHKRVPVAVHKERCPFQIDTDAELVNINENEW